MFISLSNIEKVRNHLKDDPLVAQYCAKFFALLQPHFREEVSVFSCFLIYFSNLCYQDSVVKKTIVESYGLINYNDPSVIIGNSNKKSSSNNNKKSNNNTNINNAGLDNLVARLHEVVAFGKRRSKYELLRENVYTLLTNFLADPVVRLRFASGVYVQFVEALVAKLPTYDLNKSLKYLAVSESALSFLVNLTF